MAIATVLLLGAAAANIVEAEEKAMTIPLGEAEVHQVLAAGAELQVSLPGHGGSGRIWSGTVSGDAGAVALTQVPGPRAELPPAGGLPPPSYNNADIFAIRGLHPGTAVIEFTLARPHGPPSEWRRISVEVVAGN